MTTQQQWHRRHAHKLSAAPARRSTKVVGGPTDCRRRRGRRTSVSFTASATYTVVHAFVTNRMDYYTAARLRWPPCLTIGVLGSGTAFWCPPNRWHTYILAISLNICVMFSAGSLLTIGFHIGSLPWSGAACLTLFLSKWCPLLSAKSSRSLHSSQQGLLLVPFARNPTKQIRAFSVVGPSTWNALPCELRIFENFSKYAVFFTFLPWFSTVPKQYRQSLQSTGMNRNNGALAWLRTRGLPTMINRAWALVMDTLNRFGLLRKPSV